MKGQIIPIWRNPKGIRGEGCSGQPKYAYHDVSHIFFKMILRGAVLFWMTVYPWLIKPKHKIQALYYQLAIESQYSSDKSIT